MEQKLAILADSLVIISSSLDLDEALRKITESAARALNAQAGAICLLVKDENALYFKTIYGGGGENLRKVKLKLGEGVIGWAVKEKKAVLISDAKNDPRYKFDLEEKTGFQTTSIIAVPLIFGEKVIGAIEVTNPKDKSEFTNEDLDFLKLLAPQIVTAVVNAQTYSKLKEEVKLKNTIVGNNPEIKRALELVEQVSKFDATVLITGESGTGKELIVRAIHDKSPRREGPFIAVNCTAIPETLLESELFGHEKGSFTGALSTRKGKFELAGGGTLFLDEIGDMNQGIQAKLLRAIETKSFAPVGSEKEIQVDVRIIAATNKNLVEECKNNRFREDLFYRLNEFQINLPPLCDRKEDIPLLVDAFINEFSAQFKKDIKGISKEAMDILINYNWPGNVRQLKSTIKQAIIMAGTNKLTSKDLSKEIMSGPEKASLHAQSGTLLEVEKEHILFILDQSKWNKAKASKILGISRPTLDTKINKYKLTQTSLD
jgi:Nif-specific regulatory protein